MSERRACRLVKLARSVYRYAAQPRDDSEIQSKLTQLAARHPEFGFNEDVSNFAAAGTALESQASLPHLLRAQVKQTAQTQTTNSDEKSAAAISSNSGQPSLVSRLYARRLAERQTLPNIQRHWRF